MATQAKDAITGQPVTPISTTANQETVTDPITGEKIIQDKQVDPITGQHIDKVEQLKSQLQDSTLYPVNFDDYSKKVPEQHPELGLDYLNDQRANAQTTPEAIMNGLGRLGGKLVVNTLQSAGYLAGAIPGLLTMDFSKVIDNPLVQWGEQFNKATEEHTPIYQTTATQQQSPISIDNLLSNKFIFGDLLGEGGSFIGSAWLTGLGAGALVSKLGMVGLGSKMLQGAIAEELSGVAAKGATQDLASTLLKSSVEGSAESVNPVTRGIAKFLNQLPKHVASTINAYTMAGFMGRGEYTDVLQKLKANNDNMPDGQKLSDDKINEKALAAGKESFVLNMALLPLAEFQYGSLFKSPQLSRRMLSELEGKLGSDVAGDVAEQSTNKFEQGALKVGKRFTNALVQAPKMGLQTAINDISEERSEERTNALGATAQVFKQFLTHFSDPKYADTMLQGFLLGLPFGAGHTEEPVDHESILAAYKDKVGKFFGEDIYKKNEDGSTAINEQGKKILKDTTTHYMWENLKNEALSGDKPDYDAYDIYSKLQFADFAKAHFDAGLGRSLQNKLSLEGQKKPDEFLQAGITDFKTNAQTGDPMSPQEIADEYKQKAKDLESIYNTVKTAYPGNDRAISEALRQKVLRDKLGEVNADILKYSGGNPDAIKANIHLGGIDKLNEQLEEINNDLSNLKGTEEPLYKNRLEKQKVVTQEIIDNKKQAILDIETKNPNLVKNNDGTFEVDDPVADIFTKQKAGLKAQLENSLKISRNNFKEATDPELIKKNIEDTKQAIIDKNKQGVKDLKKEVKKEDNKTKLVDLSNNISDEKPEVKKVVTDRVEELDRKDNISDNNKQSEVEDDTKNTGINEAETGLGKEATTSEEGTEQTDNQVGIPEGFLGPKDTKVVTESQIEKGDVKNPNIDEEKVTNKNVTIGEKNQINNPITGKPLTDEEGKQVNVGAQAAFHSADFHVDTIVDAQGNEHYTIVRSFNEDGTPKIEQKYIKISAPGSYEIGSEIELSLDTKNEEYEANKEDIYNVPIKITQKGKPDLYLHTKDWLNKNLGTGEHLEERNANIFKEHALIRNWLINNPGKSLKSTINDKSIGYRNVLEKGNTNTPTKALGKNILNKFEDADIAVVKQNGLLIGSDKTITNQAIPGTVIAVTKTPVEGVNFGHILNILKVSINDRSLIFGAIQSYLKHQGDTIVNGYNVGSIKGLQDFIRQFTYVSDDFKNLKLNSQTFNISSVKNKLVINYGTTGKFIEGESAEESLYNLEQHNTPISTILDSKTHTVKANLIDSKNEYNHSEIDENNKHIVKKYDNYMDFLLKNDILKTDLSPIMQEDGSRSYFVQPTITFNTDILPSEKEPIEEPINENVIGAEPTKIEEAPTHQFTLKRGKTNEVITTLNKTLSAESPVPSLNIKDYKLEALSLSQQNQLVDELTYHFLDQVNNKKETVADAFDNVYDIFLNSLNSKTTNDSAKPFITLALTHWDAKEDGFIGFKSLIEQNLNNFKTSIKGEELSNEERIAGVNYSEGASLRINPKDSASANMKKFMYFIPEVDKEGKPVESILGTQKFQDYTALYNRVLMHLVDTPSYNILGKLQELASKNPNIKSLYDKLTNGGDIQNADIQLINEFNTNFRKKLSDYESVLLDNRKGDFAAYIQNASKNGLNDRIAERWKNQLLGSQYVESSITGNNRSDYQVNTNKSKELLDKYSKLVNNSTPSGSYSDEQMTEIAKCFNEIGIDVTPKILKSLNGDKENIKYNPNDETKRNLTDKEIFGGKLIYIFQRLAGLKSGEKNTDDIFDRNNPFFTETSSINLLAKYAAKEENDNWGSSFRNGEGNSVFLINKTTTQSDVLNKLQSTDWASQLEQTPFGTNNSLLKAFIRDTQRAKNFTIKLFDTIDTWGSKEEPITKGDMNDKIRQLTQLVLSQNQGGASGKFTGYTLSDKSMTQSINEAKVNIDGWIYQDGKYHFPEHIIDNFYNVAVGEMYRVRQTNEQIKQAEDTSIKEEDKTFTKKNYKDNYHNKAKAGLKFFMFPSMNDSISEKPGEIGLFLKNGKINPEVFEVNNDTFDKLNGKQESQIPFAHEVMNHVKGIIADELDTMVKQTIEDWKKSGVIFTNKGGVEDIMGDRSYKQNNLLKSSATNMTDKLQDLIKHSAVDFLINDSLNKANLNVAFFHDLAQYWKTDMKGTLDNFHKRSAMQIAPREVPNFGRGETRKVIYIKDFYPKFISDNLEGKVLDEVLDQYKAKNAINATDAQELSTRKEYLYTKYKAGKIEPSIYNSIIFKIDKSIEDGSHHIELTPEEDIELQPNKPVDTSSKIENGINNAIYNKTSQAVLAEDITDNQPISQLRKLMEKYDIASAIYESGAKLGMQSPIDIWNEEGNLVDNLEDLIANNHVTIPREGWGIQQDMPYHDDNTITQPTQERVNLFADLDNDFKIEDTTIGELREPYNEAHSWLIDKAHEQLNKEWGVENGQLTDLNKLSNYLIKQGKALGWNPNELAALKINPKTGKFAIDMAYSTKAEKIEPMITSLISNNLMDIQLPGHSYIQTSSVGHKRLGYQLIDPKDNSRYSEIALAWRFKDKEGNLLPFDKYINKDGTPKEGMIDDELHYQIGMRIPHLPHNSTMRFKVVRYLDPRHQDMALVPHEIVKQMGSDFDIDKLYNLSYNYNIEDDGKISKIGSNEDTIESKQNKIIDINHKIAGSEELLNKTMSPADFTNLKIESDRVDNLLSKDIKQHSILYWGTTDKVFKDNKAGKDITAMAASSLRNHTLSQETRLHIAQSLSGKDDSVLFKKDNGEIYHDNSEIRKGAYLLNKVEGFNKKPISSYIGEVLQSAVDQAKAQILAKAGINTFTFGVNELLNKTGFDETFTVPFLRQPSIEGYISKLESLNDPTLSFEDKLTKKQLSDKILEELKSRGVTEVKALSRQEMNDSLTNGNQKIQDQALYNFIAYDKIAGDMTSLKSAMTPASKRLGKSISDVKLASERISNIMSSVFGEGLKYINGGEEFFTKNGVNTREGNIIKQGIMAAETLGTLFPYYTNAYEGFEDSYLKEVGKSNYLTSKVYDLIHTNMKASSFTKEGFISTDVEGDRRKLNISEYTIDEEGNKIYSNKSLATRVIEVRTKDPWLDRLASGVKMAKTYGNPDEINYDAAKAEDDNTSFDNSLKWYNALHSSDPEVREIAKDLITYSYLNGGVQSRSSFVKYIPIDWAKENLISENGKIDFENLDAFNRIQRQIFQHNPIQTTRVKQDTSQITDATGKDGDIDTFKLKSLDSDNMVSFRREKINDVWQAPKYLSRYSKSANKYRLYEDRGDGIYQKINTLGTGNMYEYVFDKDVNQSIYKDNNINPIEKVENDSLPGAETKEKVSTNFKELPTAYQLGKKYHLDGGNGKDTLESIIKDPAIPAYGELSKLILPKLGNIKNEFTTDPDIKGRAIVNYHTGDTVTKFNTLNEENEGRFQETVLHEDLHSLTMKKIYDYYEGKFTDEKTTTAIKSLEKVYEFVQKNKDNIKMYRGVEDVEGAKNNQEAIFNHIFNNPNDEGRNDKAFGMGELISYGLTDIRLQRELNDLQYGGKSILQRIVDLIKSIVFPNLKEGSALSELVSNVLKLTSLDGEEENKSIAEPVKVEDNLSQIKYALSNPSEVDRGSGDKVIELLGDKNPIINSLYSKILKTEQYKQAALDNPTSTSTEKAKIAVSNWIEDNLEGRKTDFKSNWDKIKEILSKKLENTKDADSSNSKIQFEENPTIGYRERTIKNASADATIALATDFNSAGEKLTKSSVESQNKKYIPINANSLEIDKNLVDRIVQELNNSKKKDLFSNEKPDISLNIAGNGIYTMKGKYTQEQIDNYTKKLLEQVISSPNLKVNISSIKSGGQTGFDEAGAKAGESLGIPTSILAPKGWLFRNENGQDIASEELFKNRFNKVLSAESPSFNKEKEDKYKDITDPGIKKVIMHLENQKKIWNNKKAVTSEERSQKQAELQDIDRKLTKLTAKQDLATITGLANENLSKANDLINNNPTSHNLQIAKIYMGGFDTLLKGFDYSEDSPESKKVGEFLLKFSDAQRRLLNAFVVAEKVDAKRELNRDYNDDIFAPTTDVNWMSSHMINGGLSHNRIEQLNQTYISESSQRTENETYEIHKTLDKFDKDLTKSYGKNYKDKILRTGLDNKLELITRTSLGYYREVEELQKNINNAVGKDKSEAIRELSKFKLDNGYRLDLDKLKAGETDDRFSEDSHKRQQELLDKYEEDRANYIKHLDNILDHEFGETKQENEAVYLKAKTDRLKEWEHENSPYIRYNTEKDIRSGEANTKALYKKGGSKYLIPSKVTDQWVEPKYNELDNNPKLKEFYKYLFELREKYDDYIDISKSVRKSDLPEAPRPLMKNLFDIKGAFHGLSKEAKAILFKDAIDHTNDAIDPITNKPVQRLRNGMMQDKLSQEERSDDIIKIFKLYASMGSAVKNKTEVEDLILNGIDNIRNQENIKGDTNLKNTIERANYAVEAFYGNKKADELETKPNEKGEVISGAKVIDSLLHGTIFTRLAMNPIAAITRHTLLSLTNRIHASSGLDFTTKEYSRAGKIVNSLKGDTRATFNMFMRKMGTVGDFENIGESTGKGLINKLMFMMKHQEIIGQGRMMVAALLHIEVSNNKGETYYTDSKGNQKSYNLWDAMNKDGFKPEFSHLEDSRVLADAALKVKDLSELIHGNYHFSHPILGKKNVLGRALSTFRNWIPNTFNNRFAAAYHNDNLGREFKGRWLSYGDLWKSGNTVKVMQNFLKIARNQILGKDTEIEGMLAGDIANMRSNIKELMLTGAMMATFLVIQKEKNKKQAKALTYISNILHRNLDELSFYYNPGSFVDISKNIIPAVQTVTNFGKIFHAVGQYAATGNDKITGGEYSGQSRVGRAVKKALPLSDQVLSTEEMMNKTY